jgi:GPH family glycoside/pentoside/hexuronide:cation symporter
VEEIFMADLNNNYAKDVLLNTKIRKADTEEKIPFGNVVTYGFGNFASQLSWTMVSTYLALFYTDVFGLATGAVALLMLITKVWDGIFDPVLGGIMERTHTKWGRFRPFILFGSPLLLVFTILTFTVPNFGSTAKLVYAYVTYIGLSMAYSITNVPYGALPAVMTRNPKEINKLNTAKLLGMTTGMIALNLFTLPLVTYLGNGVPAAGYQKTASLFAIIALPIFLLVFKTSKEKIVVSKEDNIPLRDATKFIFRNAPLMSTVIYVAISMIGMFGRLGVAVFYYIYVVGRFDLITIFMMMQMIVGTIIMPFSPKVMEKLGKKKTCILAMIFQALGMLMIFFGDPTNIPFLFVSHIVYGLGYISGPCGSSMIIDSIEYGDYKLGGRADGTAFAMSALAEKIASAVGASLGIFLIGLFGYAAGQEITPEIARGINISVNLVPAICFLVALIPLAFYNLSEEKMAEIRAKLQERNSKK